MLEERYEIILAMAAAIVKHIRELRSEQNV
jgi:hypothetical protein